MHQIDLVGIETHRAGDRSQLRGGSFGGGLDVLALQCIFDNRRAVRDGGDTTQGDAAILPVSAVGRETDCHRDEREVIDLAILELVPGHHRASRGSGNEHLSHYFIALEHVLGEDVLARPVEVIVEVDRARSTRTGHRGLSVQGQQ